MQFNFQPGFTAVNVGWDEATGCIGHIVLNRPNKSNAFNSAMWREFPAVSVERGQACLADAAARQCLTSRACSQAVRLLQQREEIRVVRHAAVT